MARRSSETIPATQLDEWFDAEHGSRLEAEGFSPVRRRVWLRSDKRPIREGFAVASLKGYAFVPTWFVSLDFVPHLTGAKEVRWHRTEKSALADLQIDPLDTPGRYLASVLEVHGIGSARVVRRRIRHSARLSVRFARAWFSRISDVPSLLPVFEQARRRHVTRFAFDRYPQQPLALAFLLARLGDVQRAHREFDAWCRAQEDLPSAAEDRLRELLRAGSEQSR